MAKKMYFRYGGNGSGKTLDALITHYNYIEQGHHALLFTSINDSHYHDGYLNSSIGLQTKAYSFDPFLEFENFVKNHSKNNACIIVDEAQELTKSQVYQLQNIVHNFNIPVIAYGLKNDQNGSLYEGSAHLFLLADKVEEVTLIPRDNLPKLYFRFGTMNSGKSLYLLAMNVAYQKRGFKTAILTFHQDKRFGEAVVASRTGIQEKAITYDDTSSILDLVHEAMVIIVDEAQFLTERQVEELVLLKRSGKIVHAFGLKNDFQNNLFSGSKALLEKADDIIERKTKCLFCDSKATQVLRLIDGEPTYTGEQIQIGGNIDYIPTCSKCYKSPDLKSLSFQIFTKENAS